MRTAAWSTSGRATIDNHSGTNLERCQSISAGRRIGWPAEPETSGQRRCRTDWRRTDAWADCDSRKTANWPWREINSCRLATPADRGSRARRRQGPGQENPIRIYWDADDADAGGGGGDWPRKNAEGNGRRTDAEVGRPPRADQSADGRKPNWRATIRRTEADEWQRWSWNSNWIQHFRIRRKDCTDALGARLSLVSSIWRADFETKPFFFEKKKITNSLKYFGWLHTDHCKVNWCNMTVQKKMIEQQNLLIMLDQL